MLNFNRQFLPKHYKRLPKDEQIQAKFLVVNAGSTVLWGPVMVIIFYLLGSPRTAIAIFGGFIISMTSIIVLRKTAKVRLSGSIMVIGLFCMFVTITLLNNGIHFGGLIWIMILPLLALNALSWRASVITLVASILLISLLKLSDVLGFEIASETTPENHQFVYYISLLLVLPIILAIGVAYRSLLRSALAKERELNIAKTKFVSNVSHELRTPLNGIIGIVELLKQKEEAESLKEDLHTIEYSGQHLLGMVNDILDLAEAQTVNIKFNNAPYQFKDNVKEVIRSLTSLANSKNLSLTCYIDDNVPDILFGDGKRVDQLLLNFIGNSLKFTHEGGVNLAIETVYSNPANNEVELRFIIKDSGIGIPEHDLSNLFEPFYQVDDSSTRKYAGSGLGLTICQQIIDSLRGKIVVSSEVGSGSIFQFNIFQQLPDPNNLLSQLDSKENIDEAIDKQFLEYEQMEVTADILVAEDNVVNQIVLRKMLEAKNHRVTIVSNGFEAIEQLQQKKFDIILLDGHMPELDGYSAARKMRQEMNIKTPIIAVTAGVTETDKNKCIASGMDEILSKPIMTKPLYRCINYWLHRNN